MPNGTPSAALSNGWRIAICLHTRFVSNTFPWILVWSDNVGWINVEPRPHRNRLAPKIIWTEVRFRIDLLRCIRTFNHAARWSDDCAARRSDNQKDELMRNTWATDRFTGKRFLNGRASCVPICRRSEFLRSVDSCAEPYRTPLAEPIEFNCNERRSYVTCCEVKAQNTTASWEQTRMSESDVDFSWERIPM